MKSEDIKQKILSENWDDDLINNILLSNDDEIFILALRSPNCPVDLILDLWQALNPKVRYLVCSHPNTPISTLRRISEIDSVKEIRENAKNELIKRGV
jgi:hypothetical protein